MDSLPIRTAWIRLTVPLPNLLRPRRRLYSSVARPGAMLMWRMLVTIFLASLLGVSAYAQASSDTSDPKARALMAECRVASGGQALDKHVAFHETGTIIRDGKAGTYEMYGDLHALRTAGIHTLEGKVGGGGFDGTTVWHLGPDGKVTKSTDAERDRQRQVRRLFHDWRLQLAGTISREVQICRQPKLPVEVLRRGGGHTRRRDAG